VNKSDEMTCHGYEGVSWGVNGSFWFELRCARQIGQIKKKIGYI
jgi:hypothetical protein